MHTSHRHRCALVGLLMRTVLFATGCDGGFNCPLDRPACCDNVLFGCGTFDLPDGCTCANFLYSPITRGYSAARASTTSTLSGTYRVELNRSSSSCAGLLPRVTGSVGVRENKGAVTVTIPGYGVLKGKVVNRIIRAAGSYRALFFNCTVGVRTAFSATRPKGTATADLTISCGSKEPCTASIRERRCAWEATVPPK